MTSLATASLPAHEPLRLIPVSDPDDPRIADYRDVRERDLVGRRGLFMAEGEVVLRLLTAHGGRDLHSVLVSQASLPRIVDALDLLPRHVPVHVAGQAVMDAIVGFHIHRGILAVGRARPQVPAPELLASLPERALVVALQGITNHDNMGGIFRNAAAFGADAVLLDAACCDPLYRKAIRVSVGASLIVPTARAGTTAEMMEAIAAAGFDLVALSPSGRERLSDIVPGGRQATLFGTEGPGLPPEVLASTRTISIPMAAGFDSLNVATTSGIVLHHLSRTGG
jgi:tRNA G18 (ribose-2'-O)-methylase SpoU